MNYVGTCGHGTSIIYYYGKERLCQPCRDTREKKLRRMNPHFGKVGKLTSQSQ